MSSCSYPTSHPRAPRASLRQRRPGEGGGGGASLCLIYELRYKHNLYSQVTISSFPDVSPHLKALKTDSGGEKNSLNSDSKSKRNCLGRLGERGDFALILKKKKKIFDSVFTASQSPPALLQAAHNSPIRSSIITSVFTLQRPPSLPPLSCSSSPQNKTNKQNRPPLPHFLCSYLYTCLVYKLARRRVPPTTSKAGTYI